MRRVYRHTHGTFLGRLFPGPLESNQTITVEQGQIQEMRAVIRHYLRCTVIEVHTNDFYAPSEPEIMSFLSASHLYPYP